MSAGTINQATKDDIGLMPDDPLVNIFERNESTPREAPTKAATLDYVKPDSFRFRTHPDHGNTEIRLRIAEETGDLDKDVKLKKSFERWAARELGGPDKKLTNAKRLSIALETLKMDRLLWESENVDAFKFRPIPGLKEATFETRDPRVAAYIRMRIQEPAYQGVVYEDVKAMLVEIDGELIEVLPANAKARFTMAAHAAAGSQE